MAKIRHCNEAASTRHLPAAMVAMALLLGAVPLAPALAQSNSANPAATINGSVPKSEGNIWNGMDHQPTEAEVPQGNMQQQQQINNQLNQLDQQLMNEKLPKVPQDAPPVSGN
ncbi:MAG TPA: hypothetical protein VL752_08545 [Acidisoma sp.]|uniref:hypothetical protein n=1 Tax=Acidisoma sp. TaxID=1872115 RepID=UPI002BCD1CF3|nr:hypothetical protein [Acidisoma sp.]HTI00980.1 hypothetical protein [Acidisoma sp.]